MINIIVLIIFCTHIDLRLIIETIGDGQDSFYKHFLSNILVLELFCCLEYAYLFDNNYNHQLMK